MSAHFPKQSGLILFFDAIKNQVKCHDCQPSPKVTIDSGRCKKRNSIQLVHCLVPTLQVLASGGDNVDDGGSPFLEILALFLCSGSKRAHFGQY